MSSSETFEDGVAHIMMMVEESRQNCGKEQQLPVVLWRHDLDAIVQRLDFLIRKAMDDPGNDVKKDMYHHCQKKVVDLASLLLEKSTSTIQGSMVWDEGEGEGEGEGEDLMEGQASIARIAELAIVVHFMKLHDKDPSLFVKDIIDKYAQYQRQVLRQRSKPAIARLAHWRKTLSHYAQEEEEGKTGWPHSDAIMVVLGQASSLIHPLLVWRDTIPPGAPMHDLCQTSIRVLDDQAQSLTKTISTWLLGDRKVDEWVQATADLSHAEVDLTVLDSLVGEMAFFCQLLARYEALLQPNGQPVVISKELLPEWTWKYASLERYLGMKQLQYALRMASPVSIVVGLPIKVPSVVEDAQYLSTRALDRATSTRSTQALGTVAHSLSHDIWSTDLDGGVYQALIDQKGCWSDPETEKRHESSTNATKTSGGGGFASALLDALDEDLKHTKKESIPSAPSSGGFLGVLVSGGQQMQKMRLETQICSLNGIHSASTACISLFQSLDAWLAQEDDDAHSSMTKLAREELLRYSQAYKQLLEHQVESAITEWCGSPLDGSSRKAGQCLYAIRDSFGYEDYELDRSRFGNAEASDRLEKRLLDPLKESLLISYLDRCDSDVRLVVCVRLSVVLAKLIVETLWANHHGRVTDWGSLLLSKQVRLLQTFVESLAASSVLDPWERLSQIITVLQLERPSDWSMYPSILTVDELKRTLSLRVDFSKDAIAAACQHAN